MEIIQKRETVYETYFERAFEPRSGFGSGFGFPCDKDGEICWEDLAIPARKNAELCLSGHFTDLKDVGVKEYTSRWLEPAIGLCDNCGRQVILDGFTNTCDCGADYNSAGQRLAPRSQWGEETGESLSDILAIR